MEVGANVFVTVTETTDDGDEALDAELEYEEVDALVVANS